MPLERRLIRWHPVTGRYFHILEQKTVVCLAFLPHRFVANQALSCVLQEARQAGCKDMNVGDVPYICPVA